MLRKGMFLADRYEILEQIGTGGMSDVYRAKCHKLNRFVAIKVLKKEYSEDKTFVSKFRAEAQAAAGLTHPNIVNVYDVGDENGIYYIVMELVEGITLKKYIEKKGKIPYKSLAGLQVLPRRKSRGPISAIAGSPFANRKMQIRATAKIEVQAAIKNTACIPFSFQ